MVAISDVRVSAYEVPTVAPESDGTAEWDRTSIVVVELSAAGKTGIGYTYADAAAAWIAASLLAPHVRGEDPFDTGLIFSACARAVRNQGREGICAMAISAVDVAAWDLKCKLMGQSLARVLGTVRASIPAYGSGGFTSLSDRELEEQLGGWADQGMRFVKMKVGREPARDLGRVQRARKAIGRDLELFVDANGAYSPKQALAFAERFAEQGVNWFEEPVVRTDLAGLRLLRSRAPPGMQITGGEYCWGPSDFRAFLEEPRALDVVQADATRCGGVTGFLQAAALIEAFDSPMSSHCAPALHVTLGCAVSAMEHLEWFFDHQRVEASLFDGAPRPEHGELRPALDSPGLGLVLKRPDAERYRVLLPECRPTVNLTSNQLTDRQ